MSYLAASSPAVATLDLESNTLAAQDQCSVRESTTKNEDDLSEYKGSGNVVRYVLDCCRRRVILPPSGNIRPLPIRT
ncbi:hypothetical protein GQ600_10694 [Phytophthora cactorum]|nr:hypothetical protein GQ600_10694 [Phytophthora cactorum]